MCPTCFQGVLSDPWTLYNIVNCPVATFARGTVDYTTPECDSQVTQVTPCFSLLHLMIDKGKLVDNKVIKNGHFCQLIPWQIKTQ